MGGIGSGRTSTKPRPQPAHAQTLRVRHAAPVAWSNLKAILASTRRNLGENPDYVPPSSVLNVHQWVIEQDEGKATARLEIDQKTVNVSLSAPEYLQGLQQMRQIEAQFMLSSPDMSVMSQNNCCTTYERSLIEPCPACAYLLPDEEGWREETP